MKCNPIKFVPVELERTGRRARRFFEDCSRELEERGFRFLGLFRSDTGDGTLYNLDYAGDSGQVIVSSYFVLKRRSFFRFPLPFVSLTGRAQKGYTVQTLFDSGERLVTTNLAVTARELWASVPFSAGLQGILAEHGKRKKKFLKQTGKSVVKVESVEDYTAFNQGTSRIAE